MTEWITLKEAAAIIGIGRRGLLKRITDGLVPESEYKSEDIPPYGVTWYISREYAAKNPYIPHKDRGKNKET